jgi:lipid-A-disaccharide synthase
VVVYRANKISMAIAQAVVKVKWASLVNLIVNEEIVKEFIQPLYTREKVEAELDNIANNETYRAKMFENYQRLFARIGEPGASARTAELIWQYVSKK